MIVRPVTLLLLAAAMGVPLFATWGSPPCEDAITYQTYLRKGKDVRKYELITSGPNADKYKPIFFVEVTTEGPCKGKYANPCGQVADSSGKKNPVSPEVCKELKALAQLRRFTPTAAVFAADLPKVPDPEKWVIITEGPDAYKGAYKPRYYVRLDPDRLKRADMPRQGQQSAVGPASVQLGFYGPPNGHDNPDTVPVDPWLAHWLSKLIKKSK